MTSLRASLNAIDESPLASPIPSPLEVLIERLIRESIAQYYEFREWGRDHDLALADTMIEARAAIQAEPLLDLVAQLVNTATARWRLHYQARQEDCLPSAPDVQVDLVNAVGAENDAVRRLYINDYIDHPWGAS